MKEKLRSFRILWKYLKDDKVKLFFYVLLVLLTYLPALLSSFIWGFAIEFLLQNKMNYFLYCLAIWESVQILFYTVLQIPRDNLYNYFEIKFTSSVSKDLYAKLDKLPAISFEDIGVGEFINRLYTDPDRVMELLAKMIKLVCKAIVVVVVLVMSFSISFLLGIEVVILGVVMGCISFQFFPRIKKEQEQIKKESDQYVKVATENITGIREIKSLGIKKNIENNVFGVLNQMFSHSKKIRKYEVWYYSLNNLAYFLIQFCILATAGYYVVNGIIAYSTFIILENYIWRIDEVVESISDFGVNFNKVTVSLKRIGEILNNELYDDEKFGHCELKDIKGKIVFEDVKFKYRQEEDYTLKGLDLVIEPKKKVAIVGKSGNGKSTIFNLLLRYFDSTEGKILIDGVNILDLTEDSLRNTISIIRQSPFLFNLSILDNFRLVKEDVSLESVREVCRRAYIDDYVMSLPNGYETIIGEGGINLSGGQKQRLAIARTLLLNTKIILFDEATSALDNESQDYIKRTIDDLVKEHTVIIVAHRLSTIIDADVIHVIDKGILSASGTHQELLSNSSVYQGLYKMESNDSSTLV